jgi:hypothetical protein
MEIGETKIIEQREQSTRASCWKEFLVLKKLSDTEFMLDIRCWDYLGTIGDLGFEEDEDGEIIVPAEINGKIIRNIDEDGFVFGGELVKNVGDPDEIKFTRSDIDKVLCWLESVKWNNADVMKALAMDFSS